MLLSVVFNPALAATEKNHLLPSHAVQVHASGGKMAPIDDGDYEFMHRFAEHPDLGSISVEVSIRGRHIVVTNRQDSDVLPRGVIAGGTLVWHESSGQWIIDSAPEDGMLPDAGGCSGGPEVVDLERHVYWTC